MTIISEEVGNIGGEGDSAHITFCVERLRENVAGTGTVSKRLYHVYPEDGLYVTDDIDPGPATVRIGRETYHIDIPDSDTPIRLWPLVDAAMPAPSSDEGWVRNAGGAARLKKITASAYAALETPDPATWYGVVAD